MIDGKYTEVQTYLDGFLNYEGKRKHFTIDKNWLFTDTIPAGWQEKGLDDKGWRKLDLPHDYSVEHGFAKENPSNLTGGYCKTGICCYRKHFTLANQDKGKHITLTFDGVSFNAKVFLNDKFLGDHHYGFTPFEYDITKYVDPDGDNVLAVLVDCSLMPYSRFYVGMGINRHVFLTVTDELRLENNGLFCRTVNLEEKKAYIEITAKIRANGFSDTVWHPFGEEGTANREASRNCMLVTIIYDRDGNISASASMDFTMENYSRKVLNQTLEITNPKLWGLQDPYLYQVKTKILCEGETVDDIICPLGVRSIDSDSDKGFFLNGQPVKLKGMCIHGDAGLYGMAVPVQEWVRRILLLKEMGCNSIRCAHYPFPTEFYHICDYLGMTVMDEAFDEWEKGWDRTDYPHGKYVYGYYLYFQNNYETDLRAMLRRDRNHPSVIMWSIGNEIPELYYDEAAGIISKMMMICREEDDSRPVTVCAEGNYNLKLKTSAMELVDIAGYNYANNKNKGRYYELLHQEHPYFKLLGTETELDPAHWQAVRDNDYVLGMYPWIGIDYLGEAADFTLMDDNTTLSREFMDNAGEQLNAERLLHGWQGGVIDITGTPKATYYQWKSLWTDVPVVKLAIKTGQWGNGQITSAMHLNFEGAKQLNVYCFTNCSEVDLLYNGVSMGRQEREKDSVEPLIWLVPYEPGCLEAIGYCSGQAVARDCLETAGVASEIQMDWITGGGMVHMDIRITDAQGLTVPGENEYADVTVMDGGSLYGLANGNLYDSDAYRGSRHRVYKGRLQAVVLPFAENVSGKITVAIRYGELYRQFEMDCV